MAAKFTSFSWKGRNDFTSKKKVLIVYNELIYIFTRKDLNIDFFY